mmetsp:Transcript_15424/g.36824  ORF Transcript_15424/g.36824 Transcript_15424/m.36824 type:complete len:220 (+) Transcript_15424:1432-2091(+)
MGTTFRRSLHPLGFASFGFPLVLALCHFIWVASHIFTFSCLIPTYKDWKDKCEEEYEGQRSGLRKNDDKHQQEWKQQMPPLKRSKCKRWKRKMAVAMAIAAVAVLMMMQSKQAYLPRASPRTEMTFSRLCLLAICMRRMESVQVLVSWESRILGLNRGAKAFVQSGENESLAMPAGAKRCRMVAGLALVPMTILRVVLQDQEGQRCQPCVTLSTPCMVI